MILVIIDALNKGKEPKFDKLLGIFSGLEPDDFAIALDIYLSAGGAIDELYEGLSADWTLLMLCLDADLYKHAQILVEKGADPSFIVSGRNARGLAEQNLCRYKKYNIGPQDQKDCQDFLDFLSSREPFSLADGATFVGSFQDGKPQKGHIINNEGTKIPGFFKGGEFVVQIFP